MNTQLLDKKDIQGLVARGYIKLPFARFALLMVTNAGLTKKYLQSLAYKINTMDESPEDYAIQIAFTSSGLTALGMPGSILSSFSREFIEGMNEPFRAFILGDQNENDVKNWVWGSPETDPVHILLLYYAKDLDTLDDILQEGVLTANGMRVIKIQDTNAKMPDSKEHFGFRDGISNPVLSGFTEPEPGEKNIKAGEVVMGYQNEYGQVSERPVVKADEDPLDLLPKCDDSDDNGFKDLGRNSSYLVYRDIRQHVYKFWKYLYDNSKETAPTKIDAAIKLGAKMVGRWPGGAPLATSPDKDDPAQAERTDFTYSQTDPDGMGCPIGAHVRRTNPRDMLLNRGITQSAEMIRKHTLMRRGRSYGAVCVENMSPEQVLELGEDGCERGLHFICLVSNISRQFEFVQNVWAINPTFNGLYKDADPIIGTRHAAGQDPNDEFTCPALPVRTKYKDMPQFTNVIGGAYFFLPGIRALKYIASL